MYTGDIWVFSTQINIQNVFNTILYSEQVMYYLYTFLIETQQSAGSDSLKKKPLVKNTYVSKFDSFSI